MSVFTDTSSRATSRVNGVKVGLVINNQDPDGHGRVQITYPTMSDTEIGHWARISVLMAGNNRGTYFLPQVGDEVLVAFENGDIESPYVIGALWNGVDQPPETNSDGKNNRRLIRSRSGHVVRLDDTDGAEKIEIIDKTGNNSIVFDSANNAITIISDQDINLSASNGTIKLTAQSISLSSTNDTKVQAQGGLTLDGTPGNTDVKGTMINLN
jgi:uncharacterized protein involved in type VI secretion and phage assembly